MIQGFLENGGPIFTAIGGVLIAIISVIAKRTPERKDPTEVMQSNINLLSSRVDALEESNKTLWDDVEKLRERVSKLWRALETAKSYIRYLESHVFQLSNEHPERPEEVETLMRE